jgi:hypothetical protein
MNFEGKTDQQAILGAREIVKSELDEKNSAFHVYNLDHAAPGILDFYRIKPIYVFLVILFHRLGFSYILATTIPSLISFFLIGSFIFYWSSQKFKPVATLIISSAFIIMNPMVILARLSSPDGLSNLFIFICFYRIYFGKQYVWTSLLLMVSLLIRMDNFFTVEILLSLMYFWPEKREKTSMRFLPYISFLLFALVICLWMNFYFVSNFWWFRNIGYIQSFHVYRHELLLYFFSISESLLPMLVLLTCIAWFNRTSDIITKNIYLMTAIALIIVVRFLVFPSYQERFMTAFYLCGFLMILDMLKGEGNPAIVTYPVQNVRQPGS